MVGYNTFVTLSIALLSLIVKIIESLKYRYPFIWAGIPMSWMTRVILFSKSCSDGRIKLSSGGLFSFKFSTFGIFFWIMDTFFDFLSLCFAIASFSSSVAYTFLILFIKELLSKGFIK